MKPEAALPLFLVLVSCAGLPVSGSQNGQTVNSSAISADWVCDAFVLIFADPADAPKTLAQIEEHNAAWDALCHETRQ